MVVQNLDGIFIIAGRMDASDVQVRPIDAAFDGADGDGFVVHYQQIVHGGAPIRYSGFYIIMKTA